MTMLAMALDSVRGMPDPARVRELEEVMAQHPQLAIQTQTLTHGQVSARAALIPAGALLTGAQTNFDNVCIVIGDIEVTTDDGPRRITGFAMLPANRGAKRVGLALADTWWITVHHTRLTDQREIEDEMTDESADLATRRQASIEAFRACAELLDGAQVPTTGRMYWDPAASQMMDGQ